MNKHDSIRQVVASIFVLLALIACGLLRSESPSTPASPTHSKISVTYGYANSTKMGDIPLAIVSPENGLQISMHDITYQQVNDIWVPGGYQLSITSASGEITEIQFLDFQYDDSLAIVGYSMLENGKSISGPSPETFESVSVNSGLGIYPDGDNPALFLKLPCSTASSNEETSQEKSPQDIWMTHISKHTVTCASGETYVFNYDKYSYMEKPWLTMSGVRLVVSVSESPLAAPVSSITSVPPSAVAESGIPITQTVKLRRDTSSGMLVIYQDVYFSDSDGDVIRWDFQVVSTTNPDVAVEGGELDIPSSEQKLGTFATGEWGCGNENYSVTVSVTFTDRAQHHSEPYEYTMECDAGK